MMTSEQADMIESILIKAGCEITSIYTNETLIIKRNGHVWAIADEYLINVSYGEMYRKVEDWLSRTIEPARGYIDEPNVKLGKWDTWQQAI